MKERKEQSNCIPATHAHEAWYKLYINSTYNRNLIIISTHLSSFMRFLDICYVKFRRSAPFDFCAVFPNFHICLGVKLIPKWNLVNIYVIPRWWTEILLLIQSCTRDTQFKIYVHVHRLIACASTIYLNNEEYEANFIVIIIKQFQCR